MRSRSDVLRARGEAKAEPPKSRLLSCSACSATVEDSACTERADGGLECPECGGEVTAHSGPGVDDASLAPVAPPAPPPKFQPKNPGHKWCGDCGLELTFTSSGIFFPCGHEKAVRVDDPKKARAIAPPPAGLQGRAIVASPAGLQGATLPSKEAAMTNVPPVDGRPAPEAAPSNRLSIAWGEARIPVDQYNFFKVGGFIATVDLRPGEDRVEAARKLLNDLEQIAEEAFQKQRMWYEKKLGPSGR